MDDLKYTIIGRKVLASYPDLSLLTDEERQLYDAWMLDENNRRLLEEMVRRDTRKTDLADYLEFEERMPAKAVLFMEKMAEMAQADHLPRVVSWWKRRLMYVAAAAVIVAFISIALYQYLGRTTAPENKPVVALVNDLKPGSYKAKLRLDGGKEIYLDSSNDGETLQQGGTRITNMDGKLVYEQDTPDQKEIYNTLYTGKGETYATILSDGSKVWLNSESSIRYPVNFMGKERHVEITGEAYFEVAKSYSVTVTGDSARRPFTVAASGMTVEVIGTEFNINSYGDGNVIRTTLVKGKVKVQLNNKNSNVFLLPKQAADLNTATHALTTAKDVDTDAAIAWHLGHFQFSDASMETVLSQLMRWYDIEMVVYQGKVPKRSFSGTIDRSDNLRQVLTLLETTGVHFRIEGRRIIVTP